MIKHFLASLTAIALLLTPVIASAANQGDANSKLLACSSKYVTCPSVPTTDTNLLEAAPLNGVASTLTVSVDLRLGSTTNRAPFTQAKIAIQHVHSNATTVTATYYCSLDGTNYSQATSRAVNAGAGAVSLFVDTVAGAVTADPLVVVDIAACRKFRVVLAGTGAPAAGDTASLQITVLSGS